jgi:DNA-binding Lrp family transcriptional regulator
MGNYSPVEKKVLTQLQRGVEPVSRPFQTPELPEKEVLALLHRAKEEGLLRRFGGVFDARRLGYKSILCALDVPADQLAEKAAVIVAHPGVTHCYERLLLHGEGDYPLLWFTLAMLHDEFDEGVSALRAQLETLSTRNSSCLRQIRRGGKLSQLETLNPKLLELPALRRFKIDVVFDLHTRNRDETFPGIDSAHAAHDESFREFSEGEKKLVRALDQNIPLVGQPFAAVAEKTGQTEEAVLSTLQKWKEQGVLRRIGAILYHREAGFKANAMCVWPVSGDVSAAGRRVAARPEVSHCYQRPCLERFPFDLYAMIHTGSWEQTDALFKDISLTCGLSNGQLFASGREFKKSSMQYFQS